MTETPLYRILEWDTNYFGFPVARVDLPLISQGTYDELIDELQSAEVELAFCFSESEGNFNSPDAKIVDTGKRFHFSKTLSGADDTEYKNIVPFAKLEPTAGMYNIARMIGQGSHFMKDSQIGAFRSNGIYEIWMRNSLNGKMAQKVFICLHKNECVGLVTCQKNANYGVIGLIGTDPRFQKQGVGSVLLKKAENWFYQQGIFQIQIITQVDNQGAVALYKKMDYQIVKVEFTYHLWLN